MRFWRCFSDRMTAYRSFNRHEMVTKALLPEIYELNFNSIARTFFRWRSAKLSSYPVLRQS